MLNLNNKILSIDIGSKNIKLVSGSVKGKKVVIDKAITIDTPEGSFRDGTIINMITLKEVIGETLKEIDSKAKQVVFSSKGTSIISRIIEIPLVKDKEMETLVQYEIKQYLPLDFEEYIIKFKKLNEFEDGQIKKCRVGAVVYPKEMAKGYWDLANELKLTPKALDISSNCINKLFSTDNIEINDENYSINDTVAVIDMGYDQIELNIIFQGILEFTRIIQGGGSFIDGNIASQLGIDTLEAEDKKIKECNLVVNDEFLNLEKDVVNDSVKLVVNRWQNEFNRMIDYYRTKNRQAIISKIYIYGGSSNIKGIDTYLENMLQIPVEKIETMGNITTIDFESDMGLERYLNAIGAIIRIK